MLFAGIDWSDQALDYHLRTADGRVLADGQVAVSPEGLAELFVSLETQAPPDQIGIAIETAQGAWMQSLLDRGYRIYPVNPKAVERFREAMSANGDKSDRIDRRVLAMFLGVFHERLRTLKPDDPASGPARLGLQVAEDPAGHATQRDALQRSCLPQQPPSVPVGNTRDPHAGESFFRRALDIGRPSSVAARPLYAVMPLARKR